jgi:hypothetical protein
MCTKSKKQAMCKKHLDPITVVKMQLTQDPPEISKVALQFSNASSPVISHNHHRSSSLGKDSVMELRF